MVAIQSPESPRVVVTSPLTTLTLATPRAGPESDMSGPANSGTATSSIRQVNVVCSVRIISSSPCYFATPVGNVLMQQAGNRFHGIHQQNVKNECTVLTSNTAALLVTME